MKNVLCRSYEQALPSDLYSAFHRAVNEDGIIENLNITAFMNYWVEERGYPILDVNINMDNGIMILKQVKIILRVNYLMY